MTALRWPGAAVRRAPLVVLLAVLAAGVLVPVATIVVVSLRPESASGEAAWGGAKWQALTAGPMLRAAGNTLLLAVASTTLATLVGLYFAWVLTRRPLPGLGVLRSAMMVPLFFSPLLTSIAWVTLAGPRAGLLTKLLGGHLNIYSMAGMVGVTAGYLVPFAYQVLRPAVAGLNVEQEEAARASGARPAVAVVRVLLPAIAPSLAAALLLGFVIGTGEFAVPVLLGPSAQVPTLQYAAFTAMIDTPTDHPAAAAIGVVLLLFSLVAMVASWRMAPRGQRYVATSGKGVRTAARRRTGVDWLHFAAAVLFVLVVVGLPYLALLYGALSPFVSNRFSLDRLNLDNFRSVLDDPAIAAAIQNTLLLAIVGSLLTVAWTTAVAYLVRRRRGRWVRAVETLALLPLAIPPLSLGIGIATALLATPGLAVLYGTVGALFLAQTLRFGAYGVQTIAGGIGQLDPDLEAAARASGAGPVVTAGRVVLPLLARYLASAWVILAAYGLVEVAMSIFLYSYSSRTVAVLAFNEVSGGEFGTACALSFLMATVGLLFAIGGSRVLESVGRRNA